MAIQQMLLGAGKAPENTYVDDVFNIDAYVGDGYHPTLNTGGTTSRNIVNGIDFTQGGLAIFRRRDSASWWHWVDTENGATNALATNSTDALDTNRPYGLKTFNNNGFTIGYDGLYNFGGSTVGWNNAVAGEYVAYSLRKSKKFFDVVTWTHGSSANSNRRISHNLGSVPGMIIVKRTNSSDPWYVYHRKLEGAAYGGGYSTDPTKFFVNLNTTGTTATTHYGSGSGSWWGDSAPTSTDFGLDETQYGWSNGDTFVAYIFAHDEQEFGVDGNASVIHCGSYTGNGNQNGPAINLGWEPQFLLCKKMYPGTSNWHILDSMRGTGSGGPGVSDDVLLMPNLTNSEVTIELADFTSTGFKNTSNRDSWNDNGDKYLFLAIRRSDGIVGKPIEDATKCFAMDTGAGSDTIPNFDSGFPVDFQLLKQPASTSDWYAGSRLLMNNFLETNDYTGEFAANADLWRFDDSKGWNSYDGYNSAYQSWMWKRHAGFDVVAYKSDELASGLVNHSLGKIPEMIWFKSRDANQGWGVYHKNLNDGSNPDQYYMRLDSDGAEVGGSSNTDRPLASAPTSTSISLLSTSSFSNYSTHRYIAMLFTSIAGISKCGGYSGSSSAVTVDCGFVPRLVIMKKRQNTGASHNGWLIFDTLRGITDGGDSYMFLDTTSAANASYDVLDLVDSGGVKGFSVPTLGSNNDTGATYVYYAHA